MWRQTLPLKVFSENEMDFLTVRSVFQIVRWMEVELIVRLTRPESLEVLNKVSLVVHTLVPERCRYCHPIAISPGPLGSVLALDLIRI